MTDSARAQRLIDEFEDAAYLSGGSYITRHGIAAVLRHIIATEADPESWYAVPTRTLEDLADALTAPTLMERAMAGDATAARQFLHEAGFTDKQGQWLPQYQPIPEATKPSPPSWRAQMLSDITRCHGTGCHQRHQCARHTTLIPDNVLLSWAVNLNPEQAHLCAYFIANELKNQ